MIDYLDRSIQRLFQEELSLPVVEQATINFATPDDPFPPSSVMLPGTNLFLCELWENQGSAQQRIVDRAAQPQCCALLAASTSGRLLKPRNRVGQSRFTDPCPGRTQAARRGDDGAGAGATSNAAGRDHGSLHRPSDDTLDMWKKQHRMEKRDVRLKRKG